MKRVFEVAAVAILLTGTSLPAQVTRQDLDIPASKKVTLKATYYNPGAPGPGMLLLHQCNSDRTSWDRLARELSEAGVHVLTFDYRGYGESVAAGASRSERRQMRRKWPDDANRAYLALVSQEGVDKTRMAAGGASCGVHQAILVSIRHPEVKTLLLLSGRTNEEGAIHVRDTADMAVFGSASEEDETPAKFLEALMKLSKHEESKMVMNNYAGHGVPMFRAIPSLMPEVVEWVKGRLLSPIPTSE